MLDLPLQRRFRFCDGLSRRDFLCIGALGVGGLTLADLLRLRAQGSLTGDQSRKAVIMVLLRGGPSHIDTFDPKPGAPQDIRGPFKPIATSVPGIQVSEILPLQAKLMDRLAIVRNIRFGVDAHNGTELLDRRACRRRRRGRFGRLAGQRRPGVRVGGQPGPADLGGTTCRPTSACWRASNCSEAPEDPGWLGARIGPFYFTTARTSPSLATRPPPEGAGLEQVSSWHPA